MVTHPTITIEITSWHQQQPLLKYIRELVFIQEQNVPEELEWDNEDKTAIHVLAWSQFDDSTLAIGTARIIIKNKQAYIGRMAVLSQWRKQGIGSRILQTCIDVCRQRGIKIIMLNAQTYALPFYQQAGFQITSEEFMDAGIPHKQMQLDLSETKN